MLGSKKSEILVFFGEIHRMISKYGLKTVLDKIREIPRELNPIPDEDIADYIITITCESFRVSEDDVKYSKKRGDINEARVMCYALMKEHIKNISMEEIGMYFGGKTRQYIGRIVNGLPLNQERFSTKVEEKFVEKFIFLSKDVHQFKMECNQSTSSN